jgi:hypothetical protein
MTDIPDYFPDIPEIPDPDFFRRDDYDKDVMDPDLMPPGLGWDPDSPIPRPGEDIPF